MKIWCLKIGAHKALDKKLMACQSKNPKFDLLIVLKLCESEESVLFVTKGVLPMPFLHVLKKMREKAFVMIMPVVELQKIIGKIKAFDSAVVSDIGLNNFEVGFLNNYCKKKQKKVILLHRCGIALPFLETFDPGYVNIREAFHE